MVELNEILRRQAIRWKKQEAKGEMPSELYEALSEGTASAYEKRIVVNLAKISRIVSDMGAIRPYSEFSKDWNYEGSVYGHTDNCELCGASIKENCKLKNEETGDQILIGNVCVYRYIEIRDSMGRVLSDAEKKEFLKSEMTEAKKDFLRADFATRFPTALADLQRWKPYMTRKWSPHATLYRTVVKRLATHGFLGAKTMKAWEDFCINAEQEFQAWERRNELVALQRHANLEADIERKKAFLAQINAKRNQFNREADEWRESVKDLELNRWEHDMVSRVATKITTSGKDALVGGYLRFTQEMEARKNINTDALPPVAVKLQARLDDGSLNEWEQSFVASVIPRIATGRSLSTKQQQVVDRLLKKA